MGALIALLVRSERCWVWLKGHARHLRLCIVPFALGFLALTYASPTRESMALFGFTIAAALYAVLLLIAVCQPDSWLSGRLRASWLGYFGRVSYAIYILHQGIYALFDALMPRGSPQLNLPRVAFVILLALVMTLTLSEVSWRFMESKLIRRAHVQYSY